MRIYPPLLIHSVLILDAVMVVVCVVHNLIINAVAFVVTRAPALARVAAAVVLVLLLVGL